MVHDEETTETNVVRTKQTTNKRKIGAKTNKETTERGRWVYPSYSPKVQRQDPKEGTRKRVEGTC